MKINKTSIAAIIFTTIFFIFIFFISLFKGITLYDIKIKNSTIGTLYFKIDKKIVLKLKDITLYSQKQKINLDKIREEIIKAIKLSKYLQSLEIENLKSNELYIKKIILNSKNIQVDSNLIKLKGEIQKDISSTLLYFKYIYILPSNIKIKNANFTINFEPVLKIEGDITLFNNKLHLKSYAIKDKIYFLTTSSAFKFKDIILTKPSIKGNFDINKNLLTIDSFTEKIKLKYNPPLELQKVTLYFDNNSLYAKIKKVNIKDNNIKNFYTSNIDVSFKKNYLQIEIPLVKFNIKEYKVLLNKITIKIFSKENFITTISQSTIKSEELSSTINNISITKKSDTISYKIAKSSIDTQIGNINLHTIIGNLIKAQVDYAKGKIFNLPLKTDKIKVDIKNKAISSPYAVFNKVPLKKIKFKNNKLTFYSNALLDKNIHQILKTILNIEIPIYQLKGNNEIFTSLDTNLSFYSLINSHNSLFKIEDINLSSKFIKTIITNKKINFTTLHSKLYIIPELNITFDSKGKIDFDTNRLHSLAIIKRVHLPDILNITNFKEFIDIDFNSNKIFFQNLNTSIDLTTNKIVIRDINPLINFTPFHNFLKHGNAVIYLTSPLKIETAVEPSINPFPQEIIHLNIEVDKNKTTLKNNFLDFSITKNNIQGIIKNTSILLDPILDTNLQQSQESNTSIYASILTFNTNFKYNSFTLLSQKASIIYDKELNFSSHYKNSKLNLHTKQGYILAEGNHFSKEELQALSNNELKEIKKANIDFVIIKTPENLIFGKIFINSATIKQLTLLNNIVAFINTIPALLSLETPGFSAQGFKIKEGKINFLLFKDKLYIKQANIEGRNLGFNIKGFVDLANNSLHLKVVAKLKMKLKKIPIVGKGLSYLFFGKDGNIDIKMIVKGDLQNPKVKQDLGKEIIMLPLHLFKRALTLPFNLF